MDLTPTGRVTHHTACHEHQKQSNGLAKFMGQCSMQASATSDYAVAVESSGDDKRGDVKTGDQHAAAADIRPAA
jgi:hypothetical protein